MSVDVILQGYEESSGDLIDRFEAIDPAQLYAPVAEALPDAPCRVLDIGAGTGRDAAWMAAQGHQVLAVEPVEALRRAGQSLHPEAAIRWLDDRLPDLPLVRALGERFECLLLSGVWQHLPSADQQRAMPVLSALLARDGRLIMSLRHGPGAPNRPCFEAAPEDVIANGRTAGLRLVLKRSAPSVQPENRRAGVSWTWLVFRRD
jgi:SAM-dependent methyltransferase